MHRRAPPALGGCAGKASTLPPSNLAMCFMLMCARSLMWAKSVEFGSWASMLGKRFHAAKLLGRCTRDLPVESRSSLPSMHLASSSPPEQRRNPGRDFKALLESWKTRNIFGKQPSALFHIR